MYVFQHMRVQSIQSHIFSESYLRHIQFLLKRFVTQVLQKVSAAES
ncbi:hypothetical protein D920_00067 [Enterococcus faecalis 13-SD-W-01]|nr:hypothetical protein D920_00067 [Enterococcus faecalis 13-SD-W-01]